MEDKKICPACGAELQPGARHCTECGARLEETEETAARAEEAAARAEEAAREAQAVFAEAPFAQQSPSAILGAEAAVAELSQEKPEPMYAPPAAPASAAAPAPAAAPAAPAVAAAAAAAAPARPVYPEPVPARPRETEDPDRPDRKSRYAPMSSVGMAVEIFLMSIPVVGFILMILWSCGVCRKIARRNLARAYLILLVVGIVLSVVLALLARFVFPEELTKLVEQVLPGYTIQWN